MVSASVTSSTCWGSLVTMIFFLILLLLSCCWQSTTHKHINRNAKYFMMEIFINKLWICKFTDSHSLKSLIKFSIQSKIDCCCSETKFNYFVDLSSVTELCQVCQSCWSNVSPLLRPNNNWECHQLCCDNIMLQSLSWSSVLQRQEPEEAVAWNLLTWVWSQCCGC